MVVAKALGADFIIVKSDSQLVVSQVLGLYQAKCDNMVAYLAKVREAMSGFKLMRMEQIPLEKNHRADVLAKIVEGEGHTLPRGVPL
ncbi:hypothetical protein LWI28_014533 [Acer negundo]|uniref:RNase H type-1 domain-containing protein n=1 Tax=Acer negundo TaxID=4023 RepID=A0AAD5IZC9_ACENE|nr:hypothetical protein LWI28_014533 [Acer negundo]